MVILSPSMITISPTYLFIWKIGTFVGPSLCTLLEYFLKKKLLSDRHFYLGWEIFTELFLSNIMKYGENDIEWQTSIQGTSICVQ